MNNKIYKKIKHLQVEEEKFIYNSLAITLNYYYDYVISNYDETYGDIFLNFFQTKNDLEYQNIEKYFIEFIETNFMFFYDSEFFSKVENVSGVYFILNENEEVIYIGKSTNLSERPLTSFVAKLPYGAKFIKILPYSNNIDIIEAIAIDYYLPVCNQKKEIMPDTITKRTYYLLLTHILNSKLKSLIKEVKFKPIILDK
jgi:hypothetical protein